MCMKPNVTMLPYTNFWLFFVMVFIATLLAHANQWGSRRTVENTCKDMQSPISRVINHISQNLMAIIDGDENLFFSPLSISIALGMVYLGARGETAAEIRAALKYDMLEGEGGPEEVHRHFHSLLTALSYGNDEYTLLTADSIYTQSGFNVLHKYSEDLKNYYGAEQKTADFVNDGENAVRQMNSWVSNKTEDMIKKMFNGPLDTSTVMVLLNAVYFKGIWKKVFAKDLTQDRNFYGISGVKQVPFMKLRKKLNSFSDPDTNYEFLELKYKGKHISMIIALSNSNATDLDLSTKMICKIRAGFRKKLTKVLLPKFKLQYEREITQDLKQLGINSMFNRETADFSGIRSKKDISVSLIKHKAVIDVNEEGSEASASSGVVFSSRSGLIFPSKFIADHPFLFFLLDKRTGSVLFMGRVSDP